MNTNTIKTELKEYIKESIQDLTKYDFQMLDGDLHHYLFNEDYYIIGYFKAEQWLKKHNISVFEGISFVQDYERYNFGNDAVRNYDNAETLVNMIVYIIGEQLIQEEQFHTKFI
tara:strand:- start:480 stop:821 length:342 start_codon:yes stop_codon:yes gene_type:complete